LGGTIVGTIITEAGFQTYGDANNFIRRSGTSVQVSSQDFELRSGNLYLSGNAALSYLRLGGLTSTAITQTTTGIYVDNTGNLLLKTGTTASKNYIQMLSGAVSIDSSVFTLTTANLEIISSTPLIRMGATLPGYDSGTGIWMGSVGGTYKLFVGASSGNHLKFDGTNLTITGQITATSGLIGAFTIGTDSLYDSTSTFILKPSTLSSVNAVGKLLLGKWDASTRPTIRVVGDATTKYVEQFYSDTNSWGLRGTLDNGSTYVFQMGSTNQIAGWAFTTTTLTNAAGKVILGDLGASAYGIKVVGTLVNEGVQLSYTSNDDYGLTVTNTGTTKLVSIGSFGTGTENQGIRIRNFAGNIVFEALGNNTAQIAGWAFDTTSFTSTNVGIHSGAEAQILLGHATEYATAKIGFKNDGSGKIASGAITWDIDGNVFLDDRVTISYNRAKSAVKILILGAEANLESNLGFGSTAYLTSIGYTNRIVNFAATIADVEALNPDVIVLDFKQFSGSITTSHIAYLLYEKGYNIIGLGNDTTTDH